LDPETSNVLEIDNEISILKQIMFKKSK